MQVEESHKKNNVQNRPWVEKYRPESIDDVISHKEIV